MKHHIVQEAYLRQWVSKNNQLNIYSIFDKKIIEKGPKWKGFWKEDYNVLDKKDNNKFDYFPEELTAFIDTKGLNSIKRLSVSDCILDGYNRSCIAFYFALQYLRSPRRRDEFNDLIDKAFKHIYKDNFINSLEKDFDINKLIDEEKNEGIKNKIKSELNSQNLENIKKGTINLIKHEEFSLKINEVGHSKLLIQNIQRIPEIIFYFKWDFLIAGKDTSFITSDNPCFTVSDVDKTSGILSDDAMSYFPLTPNICLRIKKVQHTTQENTIKITKKEVRLVNLMILNNCYNSIIARDKCHIENIIKGYDFSLHKKSKNIKVYNNEEYFLFNLE